MLKKAVKKILQLIVSLGFPITIISSIWLKLVKKIGIGFVSNKILSFFGVFPVLDHYYEPLVNPKKHIRKPLRDNRDLVGLNFNDDEQLNLLSKFFYNDELKKFPQEKEKELEYYFNNPSYASGDAEYLYNTIRHFKPEKIIEIGSGFSTLMAQNAIKKNLLEDKEYKCDHICIEPYEIDWLEKLDVTLIREKVEDVDKSLFLQLERNDILFIDSSHVIRPQGDVLFEYLEVLPILNSGVLIHVHDIFSPKDYLDEWIYKDLRLWNEQYLLEAFLMFNSEFRVIGALNYLSHKYKEEFSDKCPIFAEQELREPGAFWMIKN